MATFTPVTVNYTAWRVLATSESESDTRIPCVPLQSITASPLSQKVVLLFSLLDRAVRRRHCVGGGARVNFGRGGGAPPVQKIGGGGGATWAAKNISF